MPLSEPNTPREPLHIRRVECRGYAREDGLFDVEGHLVDTKTYDFQNSWRGAIPAGTPVHDMWIRLTVDRKLTIQAVDAAADSHPFELCPTVVPNFQALVGLAIGAGFQRRVKELLGNTEGCTHLVELVGAVATTAFQTLSGGKVPDRAAGPLEKKPRLIDTCRGWAADGPAVKVIFPDFYTGPKD